MNEERCESEKSKLQAMAPTRLSWRLVSALVGIDAVIVDMR